VEKALRVDPAAVASWFGSDVQRLPIARAILLERVSRSLATDASLGLLADLLKQAPDAEARASLVKGIELGYEGASATAADPALSARLLDAVEDAAARRRLAVRLGDPAAIDRAWADFEAGKLNGQEAEILRLLGRTARPALREAMRAHWSRAAASPADDAWLDVLAADSRPEAAEAVLGRYAGLAAGLRPKAIGLLCSRPAWAGKLLDAIEAKSIDPKDVKTPDLVQLARLGDPALKARVAAVLGQAPGAGEGAKARKIAEVRGILPEGDKGDTRRGHVVFQKNCIGCHQLFGEGQAIGPDLTGVERGNLEFVLESLVDPSRTIRKEYQPVTVALKDGRVLNGLVVEESEAALVLFDATQQKTRVDKAEIEEQQASPVSVMPEGLLETLDDTQIRDLIRYLQASGLPPE
jgi:putative heme-binding domain-containing protein